MSSGLRHILAFVATAVLLAACSTTRRIPEGEYLFTGNKKVDYIVPTDSAGKKQKLAPGLEDAISDAIAASQAFSSNVTAFNTLKSVISKGLEIGR